VRRSTFTIRNANRDANTTFHVIVPGASAVEPRGGRIDGLAPMTSCVLWKPLALFGPPKLLLARGYERVQITMMAQGMVLALDAIREQHGVEAPVVCLTETDEVWTTASDRVHQAEASGRMTGVGLQTWQELHQFATSPWIACREPRTPREGHWVKACWLKARGMRPDALADYTIEREGDGDAAVLLLPCIKWSEWVPAPDQFLAN
jgi:hypothetical protein